MEIATTKLSSRGQIVIPIEMRKDMKEGDNLIVIKSGDDLIIKPAKKVILETAAMANEAFGEAWNSKEDEEAFAYLQ